MCFENNDEREPRWSEGVSLEKELKERKADCETLWSKRAFYYRRREGRKSPLQPIKKGLGRED